MDQQTDVETFEREKGYRSFSSEVIARRFASFLSNQPHWSKSRSDEVASLLGEFLDAQVPEIASVEFLRNDMHRPGIRPAAPYQGMLEDGSAIAYVKQHYANAIAEGILTTSALRQADDRLARAYDAEMRKSQNASRTSVVKGAHELIAERRQHFCALLTAEHQPAMRYMMSAHDRSGRSGL